MRASLHLLVAALGVGLLSGCISGNARPEGVLPAEDVAPPPSLRGTAAGRALAPKAAEPAPPARSRASRELSVPSTVRGGDRLSAPPERRIRREDLEDDGTGGRSSSGSSMGPTVTPGGAVGMGGRF